MEKLKVAVIGCGNVSVVHLAPISHLENAQLIGVCDLDPKRAGKAGKQYGVPWFTEYERILELKPDLIHICTSHFTHAEIAVAASKRGIHVLTEKPMAINLSDADRMIKAAAEGRAKLGVIFQNRYNASSQRVFEIIKRGDLGEPLGCRAFVTWNRPRAYYAQSNWKGTWRQEGGGVLISQAIHSIDLMQWIMGEVDYLQGSISNRSHPYNEVEDTAEASIFFKNGARGVLYASNNYSRDADVQLEVHGEKGIIALQMDRAVISIKGQEEYQTTSQKEGPVLGKSYWGVSHARQIESFYRAVLADLPVDLDGPAGRKALEIVRAIYYSGSHQGCPVKFPFAEPSGFSPPPLGSPKQGI